MEQQQDIEGLTVRFVGGEPSDDIVRSARAFLQGENLEGPLTLTVRWAEPGVRIRDLRLMVPDCGEVRAQGPALLPALHKLCEHARSLMAASFEDRQRWHEALAARPSGTYTAVKVPTNRR